MVTQIVRIEKNMKCTTTILKTGIMILVLSTSSGCMVTHGLWRNGYTKALRPELGKDVEQASLPARKTKTGDLQVVLVLREEHYNMLGGMGVNRTPKYITKTNVISKATLIPLNEVDDLHLRSFHWTPYRSKDAATVRPGKVVPYVGMAPFNPAGKGFAFPENESIFFSGELYWYVPSSSRDIPPRVAKLFRSERRQRWQFVPVKLVLTPFAVAMDILLTPIHFAMSKGWVEAY